MYIYLVLGSVVLLSFGVIIQKKISGIDKDLNFLFTILFQFIGAIGVIIAGVLFGLSHEFQGYISTLTPFLITKMLIGSSLWFIATLTSFAALNRISASKFSVINTLSPVISIVLALLVLGEQLSWVQLLGMMIILLSVLMVTYDKEDKFNKFSKGELIAIVSVVFAGVAIVNDKGIYSSLALVPTLAIMFTIPGIYGLLIKPKEVLKLPIIIQNKKASYGLILMGFIWGVSAILYYKAIVLSDSLSLVVSISQLSTVLTVLLGLVLLKEVENWKVKILAAIISFAGLILLGIQI